MSGQDNGTGNAGTVSIRVLVSGADLREAEDQAQRSRQPLDRVLQQTFHRGLQIPTQARHVIVDAATLEALEAILGGGHVLHAQDLQRKVEQLAGISFHHVRLQFTPKQLELVAEKAGREGITVEQLLGRMSDRVYSQFFDLLGRG